MIPETVQCFYSTEQMGRRRETHMRYLSSPESITESITTLNIEKDDFFFKEQDQRGETRTSVTAAWTSCSRRENGGEATKRALI